jgi:hypothetical protein
VKLYSAGFAGGYEMRVDLVVSALGEDGVESELIVIIGNNHPLLTVLIDVLVKSSA